MKVRDTMKLKEKKNMKKKMEEKMKTKKKEIEEKMKTKKKEIK